MNAGKNGLTYAEAGVDIDAGNELVERIKPAAAAFRIRVFRMAVAMKMTAARLFSAARL